MFDIGVEDLEVHRVQRHQREAWRLLYVGALDEAKGTFELLDAVDILARRGLAVKLDLVGNWMDEEAGKQVQAETGEGGVASFRGAVDDRGLVKGHYLDADLFVFPSHSEGFPRVLYEAMCFALPVVTTMIDGIPSVMHAGVNCVAVPVGDAAALAEAIDQTLKDVTLRETLAAGGLATMRRVFAGHKTSHARQVIERVRQSGGKCRVGVDGK
jgi:glycosyltransferase involved in cell wall biosynthesis